MSRGWYVIHTYSGHEDKVKASIEKAVEQQGLKDFIHRLLIPTEDVVEIRRNKKQVKKRKFFPGYVLADMDIDNLTYWLIRNTPGVTGFLGGVKPTALPESEVQSLLQVTDARPDTGGLSGATPAEAVSWGKIDPDKLPDAVVCYLDSTIALPVLTSYALGKKKPRKLKRLYERRGELMAKLQREFEAANK